jgi:hypothetical protein
MDRFNPPAMAGREGRTTITDITVREGVAFAISTHFRPQSTTNYIRLPL